MKMIFRALEAPLSGLRKKFFSNYLPRVKKRKTKSGRGDIPPLLGDIPGAVILKPLTIQNIPNHNRTRVKKTKSSDHFLRWKRRSKPEPDR